jgi:transposase
MSQPPTKKYPAEFKERAVKLAVESDQSIAQTARDLGVNENTLHTWIGKYHRVERQEQQVQDEHLYEELKRLRKENVRLKEEREILKKAAAYTSRSSCWEVRLDSAAAHRVQRESHVSAPGGLAQWLLRVAWSPTSQPG